MKKKKTSAGIAIVWNKKLLLVHPTNNKWWGTYGIPRGGLEKNETPFDAAIRETKEETGISVPVSKIDKNEKTVFSKRKTVVYYILEIDNLSEIGLSSEVVPKNQLQIEEVDWAGFVDLKEARKRMLSYQHDILNVLVNKGLLESSMSTLLDFNSYEKKYIK